MRKSIDIEIKARFCDLAARLSPENLSRDGELGRAEIIARKNAIVSEWAKLEKEVGRRVAEEETWKWSGEVSGHERSLIEAACRETDFADLEHQNPNVWSKRGANGMSAYYIQNWNDGRGYRLFSEFAYTLDGKEHLGDFPTIEEAYNTGEAYLNTINADIFREKTQFSEKNIARDLRRLPQDRLDALDSAKGFSP